MNKSRRLGIAVELDKLADQYYQELRLDEAESVYWLALVIREKTLGLEHAEVANSLRNLANLYETMGRWSYAERFHKRAIEISEAEFGTDHPSVMINLQGLSENYINQHKFQEARDLMERQLEFWRSVLGQSHPFIASRKAKYDALVLDMNKPMRNNVVQFPLKSQSLADGTDHG
jgi:tetratricopeptide (TPR) repeat protein